jgi:hypothetical protein
VLVSNSLILTIPFSLVLEHQQPDYDDMEDENRIKRMARGKSDKGKNKQKYGETCHGKAHNSALPVLFVKMLTMR